MDPISAALLTSGIVLLAASWFLLLITSFREDFTWGLCTLFVPPLAYLYGLFRWSKANEPILFAVGGIVLLALAAI